MPLFLDFLVAFNSQDQRINLLTSSGIELMESPGTPEPIPTLSWLESPEALEALLLGLEQDEEGIDLEASHEHTSDVLVELIHASSPYPCRHINPPRRIWCPMTAVATIATYRRI